MKQVQKTIGRWAQRIAGKNRSETMVNPCGSRPRSRRSPCGG